MTTPCSGQISLSQIDTEFADGGTNPSSISSFYGIADGVPASGQIKFSDLYCKSSTPVPPGDINITSAAQVFAYVGVGDGSFTSPAFGTIDSEIIPSGYNVAQLCTLGPYFTLHLNGGAVPNSNTVFSSITVRGIEGSFTVNRSDATYTQSPNGLNVTLWQWYTTTTTVPFNFAVGNYYAFDFT